MVRSASSTTNRSLRQCLNPSRTASALPLPGCLHARTSIPGQDEAITAWISSQVPSEELPSTNNTSTDAPNWGNRSSAARIFPFSSLAGMTIDKDLSLYTSDAADALLCVDLGG